MEDKKRATLRMVTSEEVANQLGLPVETVRNWGVNPALRVGDLRAALALAADDDLVMAEGANRVSHYVTAIRVEPQSDDGEGHVTSTGGTVWLALEES